MSETKEQDVSESPERRAVESFVTALQGIIPTLDRIKTSLEESTGKIPQVSKQLNNVASATESATVEILNVLDNSATKLTEMEKNIREVKARNVQRSAAFAELSAQLAAILPGESASGINERLQGIQSGFESERDILGHAERQIKEVNDNTMEISIALQVQDITSQQIAGVSQLIEGVRTQLTGALYTFEHPIGAPASFVVPEMENSSMPRSFDHGASYTMSQDRQDSADEIIKQFQGEKD